jgi:small conductance mechanosensitive channel
MRSDYNRRMLNDLPPLPATVPAMKSQLGDLYASLQAVLVPAGLRLLAAIAIWVIGGMIIRGVLAALERAMKLQRVDATLIRYLRSFLAVVLRIALVLGILGYLGFETTSFAALLAAAGIAIGTAWSGLLSNFAAGVFLVVLRPFKVGDSVQIAGVAGTVREIGLFGTALDGADGVHVLVGNSRVFTDNIINYSTNPLRRVDLRVQLVHGADAVAIAERLRGEVAAIEHVVATPPPMVEIIDINAIGPVVGLRPFTAAEHHARVQFEGLRLIARSVDSADLPSNDPRALPTA